ncbi:hypothetical protein P691DRAFT_715441 [Macrolepiota fuliginosa MF-IS2]|uniref:DUF6533 domain-containing protein n=1 Tax=Macrolepiota fuliginosa MF-IS2 TaxID=1400762 RepID=A0A9P5WZM4_9AGAR|nr:hypothetical protein P691DRAFT_715441 [Macrolepiota fuliginosa MF-IS2]
MDSQTFGEILSANRYLSAVAVAVILWDHIITFDEECRAVWSNKRERVLWKVGFVVCRYASDAVLLFTAYILSGAFNLDTAVCDRWSWCFTLPGFFCIAFTQALVGHQILTLWAHRRAITYLIFGVLSIFFVATGILVVFIGQRSVAEPLMKTCIFQHISQFVTWYIGLAMVFELFLVAMTIVNVLDTPRTRDVEILRRLNRDGGLSFMGIFVVLLIVLCFLIWGKLSVGYVLLPPGWAFSSVITSRLFFHVNISRKNGVEEVITLDSYNLSERKMTDRDRFIALP